MSNFRAEKSTTNLCLIYNIFFQFFVNAVDVQQTFNDLRVTSGVKIKLDSGDGDQDLHVHITLREKRWWDGGIQGFLGNDPDARVGLGGGVVSSLVPHSILPPSTINPSAPPP